jgi:hypothetical protein
MKELELSPEAATTCAALCAPPQEVDTVAMLVAAGVTYLSQSAAQSAARAAAPGVTAADAVWLAEMHASQMTSLDMMVRMQGMLAQCRLSTVAAYTAVASMLMEFLGSHLATVLSCMQARRAWVTQLGLLASGDAAGAADAPPHGTEGRQPLLVLIQPPALLSAPPPRCGQQWRGERVPEGAALVSEARGCALIL